MNFKNCVYISWKIQILTILWHKITQIFTKKYYLLSKFSKLHNLETHFCELLRPRAPPFQKIKRNPLNQVTFMQKSCFLGPTIFEIPQSNWYYCSPKLAGTIWKLFTLISRIECRSLGRELGMQSVIFIYISLEWQFSTTPPTSTPKAQCGIYT